jgi:probable rRNA maturation factor
VNLLVTGDAQITALNRQFLQHDYATDVLAFPDGDVVRGKVQLGDIVINAELAAREAAAHHWRRDAELALYALHGFLHLLGYDDHAPAARVKMFAAQRRAFSALGLTCPL